MSLYPTVISSTTNLRPKPKPKPGGGIVKSKHLPDGTIIDYGLNPNAKPGASRRLPVPPKHTAAPPPTDAQLAEQQIDPLIKAITDRVNARATSAQQAVTGYGNSLASYLSGINYAQPYQQAIPQQASVDSALQQSLSGKGNDLAQSLASRLASLQEPHAVDPAVQAVQQFGVGTGNTQLAQGSASIGNLLANQASAGEYGLKQPGIARTATLQALGKVNAQAVNDIADQTGALTAKVPDIVANIQTNKARVGQQDIERALTIWKTTGKLPAWAAKEIGVPAGTPTADFTHQKKTDAARTAAAKAKKTPHFDASNSRAVGYRVDQNGNPIGGTITPLPGYHVNPTTGSVVKDVKPVAPKGPKPLTPNDKARLTKVAEDLRYGVAPKQQWNAQTQSWMDVPGTGTPNSSYNEAYARLVAAGASPKWARAQVNRLYKPGEFGRPKSAGQKKTAAAVKSGLGIPTVPSFGPPPVGQ